MLGVVASFLGKSLPILHITGNEVTVCDFVCKVYIHFWRKELVIKYEGFSIFDTITILILTSGMY